MVNELVVIQATTIEEVQKAVANSAHVVVRGGGTKTALCAPAGDAAVLDLTGLSGVLEYEPGEFTFTALAGTRLATLAGLLAEHGQYLPFDPPLVEAGATLGGTVAAGLSGPGRYRFGGVRDFILGVRFIDGTGKLVRGGGKVVKNAAGFDLPKLMVGSLGQYGVLAEFSFKVFPRPEATLSLRARFPNVAGALGPLRSVYTAPVDVDALDLVASEGKAELWVRLGGLSSVLAARAERLGSLLGGAEVLAGPDEEVIWRDVREMRWVPAGWSLIKVPLSPARLASFENTLAGGSTLRRYSAGGNVAWVAVAPEQLPGFEAALSAQSLAGLLVLGPPGRPLLGQRTGEGFARRVKAALDPNNRFISL